jgi:hypothetical protein
VTQPRWRPGQDPVPGPGQPLPPQYQPQYEVQPPVEYAQVGVPVEPIRPPRRVVDAGRLWAGGFATALVAALIAVAGILIARGVLKIPVLAPKEQGTWGNASTLTYALVAFGAGLIATGLIHALLITTPSPFTYFGWIMGLATVVAAALPFTSGAATDAKIATAVINALIGIAIWTLTDSSARRSFKFVQPGVTLR